MIHLGPIPINLWVIAGCAVINIPIFLAIGSMFFGGWAGFKQALLYSAKPDLLSAMDGEYWDDKWAEIKLNVFFVVCVLIFVAEYAGYLKLFVFNAAK